MWNTSVPIFEDEDEAALIASFVTLSARYQSYSNFEIAQEVFRNLRDPEARANQAALIWGNSLAIKERIRKARQNGGEEPVELSAEEKAYTEAMARANDDDVPWTVRYKYFEIAQKIKGIIKEPAEAGKDKDKGASFPTFVFKKYDEVPDATQQ